MPTTFAQFSQTWLKSFGRRPRSEVLVLRKHLLPEFGAYALKAIDAEVVQEVTDRWIDSPGSVEDIRARLLVLHDVFDGAHKAGLVDTIPLRRPLIPARRARGRVVAVRRPSELSPPGALPRRAAVGG